ncbi:MAG: FAD-dependent monooxygenase [Steroidobacteraceae bacterium]|jgi:salicylate hydroxylase|nr:FAD-dependent monooxygenase [Steroidobacteraceae bacterium]
MKDLNIAIVGAGIGGLSAALALQRLGFRVTVHEQAPRLAEVGAGLSLSPTAVHGLNWLGMQSVLESKAYKPEDQCVRHWQDARPLGWINRGRDLVQKYGERYYLIHRADLHDGLAARVRAHDPAAIVLNRRCERIEQDADGVDLAFGDGTRLRADVLIGADGSRSAVRQALFGALEPQYTGYIAWRGLVPMELVPPEILEPPSGIFLGPGHLVNRYPVRNGELLNFVAFAERRAWSEEGWSIRSTVQELLDEFSGWTPWVRRFMELVPSHLLFKWGLFDREPLAGWSKGRITLLGDAAHPVLPFLGHGAVLAIEDGVVLARAFAASDSVPEALSRYEAARRERAAFVVHESRKAGRQFHAPDTESYRERTGGKAADEGIGLFSYNPVTQPV